MITPYRHELSGNATALQDRKMSKSLPEFLD
jgi:hypothetical protein